jgi:crossover junction endodeoxyribonuclease RuvC
MTTILGIDPGYGRLGWAIGKKVGAGWDTPELGCIETAAHLNTYQRYQQLEDKLQKVINKYKPDEAALETLFFSNNQKTAMQVAESRGIILAALIRNKLPITQYNPMEIKETVTGNGRADKKAVEKMIRMEFKLRDKKVLDDAIDALAVVLTHSIRSCNHKYYA